MKQLFVFAAVFFCLPGMLQAETYFLDLEKSIEVAKQKSYTMLKLKQDLKIAAYNLRSATSRFKTHVNLNLTSPEYSETMSRFEDSTGITFYASKKLTYGGNLTIDQPLPTDGKIYIESNLFDYDDYVNDKRFLNLGSRLGFEQPINSLYGYNAIRTSFKQAELAYESAQKQQKREELNLTYNVTHEFFNLLSMKKAEEIARLNLDRQQEAYDIAKNKYESGLIKEVDALQMEVDLAEAQNNYEMSIVDQSSVLNAFKELIGINLKDSVVLSNALEYKVVMVDPEDAVHRAMNNRLEIREQEIQIELNKLNIKRQKSEGMIQGDLTAYIQKNGVSEQNLNSSIPGVVSDSYTDLLKSPKNYGIGFNLSIPIIDWGENKALVHAAKSKLQQNLYRQEEIKRSIEREVRNLVAEISSSLRRLQLLEKNVSVAEKSFEITRQRFSDGDIDSQALALERERLNTAYNSHLKAYINYQLLLADIMRKTLFDYQRDTPIK